MKTRAGLAADQLENLTTRKHSALERAIAIGAAVDRYTEAARPLRELARHVGGNITPSTLSRALGVYQLCTRAPAWRTSGLSLSHFEAVLPLSEESQDTLLSRAVTEQWTVRQLRAAARGAGASAPGAVDGWLATVLGALERAVAHVRGTGPLIASRPSHRQTKRLLETVNAIRRLCDEVERAVGVQVGAPSRQDTAVVKAAVSSGDDDAADAVGA